MDHREILGSRPFSQQKIRAIVWLDQLTNAYGLRCAAGDFTQCGLDEEACKKKAGYYLNSEWDQCPVRCVIDDERKIAALKIEKLAKISPRSNWPDGYTAWLPELVCALKDARDERIESDRRK